ncbi:MAG: hypothetical protein ACK53Y_28415 [bacterium]
MFRRGRCRLCWVGIPRSLPPHQDPDRLFAGQLPHPLPSGFGWVVCWPLDLLSAAVGPR